jgi:hypothetical protein
MRSERSDPSADLVLVLLMEIIRLPEAAPGGPLGALLKVIADQAAAIGQDIDELYKDMVIESADDWVVPSD